MNIQTTIEMSSPMTSNEGVINQYRGEKKALCNLQDGTLVSSSSPPIIAVGPDGVHHIGFNASVCRPPSFQNATANSRDTIHLRNRNLTEAGPAITRRTSLGTLRSVQPINGQQIAGARRLRSGHLLYDRPEYFTKWNLNEFKTCSRREPFYFVLIALLHLVFVTFHVFNDSEPATKPSNINMDINSHSFGTIPTSDTMEQYNVVTIIITSFGIIAMLLQNHYFIHFFLSISMIHFILALSQITTFSFFLRLIPHGLLILIALVNRDKITYTI